MKKLFRIIPVALILLSILVCFVSIKIYFKEAIKQFKYDFKKQNVSELYSSDIYTISKRLNSLSEALHMKCVKGSRNGEIFYDKVFGNSVCTKGFFDEKVEIRTNIGDEMGIEFLISMPKELKYFFLTFIVLQSILLLLLFVSSIHRERNDNKEKFDFLRNVLEELSSKTNPSKKLLSDHPDIANSWNRMKNQLLNLKEEVINMSKLAAIGQSTAMLAHDVRKPFSMIKMIVDRFDSFKNNPSSLKTAKEDIDKSIKHVEGMISDIMDFSREVKLETNPASVVALLDFSTRLSAQNHKDSDITLIYDLKHTFKPLVDDERMSRVLSNIITNGIEAIIDIGKKEKGKIKIETEIKRMDSKDFVEIRIANDGPPIKEEDISKLFEPFFTKGKKKGTGLGLASCQKIINLHGGNISVRNCCNNTFKSHPRENGDPEDKTLDSRFRGNDGVGLDNNTGVEFIIDLPASNIKDEIYTKELPKNIKDIVFVEIKKAEEDINQEDDNNGQIVLFSDDDSFMRMAIEDMVKEVDDKIEFHSFENGEKLLDKLKTLNGEKVTVLTDQNMGAGITGLELTKEIKQSEIQCKIFMISNEIKDYFEEKALSAGADGYLESPVKLDKLKDIMR